MQLQLDKSAAPADYREVRRGFQIMRAFGGGGLALVGLISIAWVTAGSPRMILPGSVIFFHALNQLRHPAKSAHTSLLMDTSLSGLVILLTGPPQMVPLAVLGYVVVSAVLLLPPKGALSLIGYASLWEIAILRWAPVTPADSVGPEAVGTVTWIGVAIVLIVIAGILIAALRSIFGTRNRHHTEVESQREAIRLKDEFVSMVSHELRTPLTSIAGFVETLRDDWRHLDHKEVDEFLTIVHTEAQHLSHLVEDVLVIPRIEAGRLRISAIRFELRPLVHHLIEVLDVDRRGKAVAIEIASGQVVAADPNRVQQVLRNLLTNAFNYGGDQILISGERVGEMFQVAVSDNGPGVSEEDRGRIFDHFEQGSAGDARTSSGIGLGLPIARKLVRAMGGDLWYEPRFPTGSRFCCTIRVAQPAPADPAPVNEEASDSPIEAAG